MYSVLMQYLLIINFSTGKEQSIDENVVLISIYILTTPQKRTKSKAKDQKCTYQPPDIFSTQTFFPSQTQTNKPEPASKDEETGASEGSGT